MELTGERTLPASRARVWAALNDTAILSRCIPGCQEIQKASDTEFTAKVGLAVGPVKATFNGQVTLSDLDPPNGYRISGTGQGGVAGFGKGSAVVTLEDAPGGGTLLRYSADASVGGKLAQIGSRLVEATARKLADEFFTRFAAEFPAEEPAKPEPRVPATPEERPVAGPRLSPWIWIPLLVAAVAAIAWFARG
jgi:carbon monoxide dehydrogenase subunit G